MQNADFDQYGIRSKMESPTQEILIHKFSEFELLGYGTNNIHYNNLADPWHFGVDPDPDTRIHASD